MDHGSLRLRRVGELLVGAVLLACGSSAGPEKRFDDCRDATSCDAGEHCVANIGECRGACNADTALLATSILT